MFTKYIFSCMIINTDVQIHAYIIIYIRMRVRHTFLYVKSDYMRLCAGAYAYVCVCWYECSSLPALQ